MLLVSALLLGSSAVCQEEGATGERTGSFTIGSAVALCGHTVRLPFVLRGNDLVAGFAVSLDFDEETLVAEAIEEVFHHPDLPSWEYQKLHFDNANARPGNAGIDEGFLTATGVFDTWNVVGLPPDTDGEVLAFHFRVKPEAASGPTEIRYMDGAPSDATGRFHTVNDILVFGVDLRPPTVMTPGLVDVLDFVSFVRGDATGDSRIDIADPVRTLGVLFLGEEAPSCLDAHDSNDDGRIDVADPIHTLEFLFLGRDPPPPPRFEGGGDPTEDSLGCSPSGL